MGVSDGYNIYVVKNLKRYTVGVYDAYKEKKRKNLCSIEVHLVL